MWYQNDRRESGRIWVDRDIDGRADHFEPCEPCFDDLRAKQREKPGWNPLELCPKCEIRFAQETVRDELKEDSRPIISDPVSRPEPEPQFTPLYPSYGPIHRIP